MQDDSLLVRQIIAGDENAFYRLVREHYESVYVQTLAMVGNPADAEELTNDVFVKVYFNISRLRRISSFHKWLRQIARNHCRDWLREHKERLLYLEEVSGKAKADLHRDSADSELIRQERIDRTLEAVRSLPKMDREIIEGFYLDDLSYKALQGRHNLSEAAVRMRLFRARQKVRERVKGLLSGITMFRWRKALISGGLEAVKLGVKTKLIAVGVIVLGGIGILTWHAVNGPASEQNYTTGITDQTTGQTDISAAKTASLATEGPTGETSEVSQKDLEEAIAFLDELAEANGQAATGGNENGNQANLSGKEELSPELKRKTEQYAELAAVLPQLRELIKKGGELIERNRQFGIRRDKLEQTSDAIPEEEQDRFYEQSDRDIRANIAEQKVYYAQIDDMIPELQIYEEWYDPDNEYHEQYAFRGMDLLEYFGKKLPWYGNSAYAQAEPWDGVSNWRPE